MKGFIVFPLFCPWKIVFPPITLYIMLKLATLQNTVMMNWIFEILKMVLGRDPNKSFSTQLHSELFAQFLYEVKYYLHTSLRPTVRSIEKLILRSKIAHIGDVFHTRPDLVNIWTKTYNLLALMRITYTPWIRHFLFKVYFHVFISVWSVPFAF